MDRSNDKIRWQTLTGNPLQVGDVRVTPQSQALTLCWPNGGLVWNRPVAILVEHQGQVERIPIVDVTRVVQLSLLGLSALLGIIALALTVRERRS